MPHALASKGWTTIESVTEQGLAENLKILTGTQLFISKCDGNPANDCAHRRCAATSQIEGWNPLNLVPQRAMFQNSGDIRYVTNLKNNVTAFTRHA